MLCYASIEYIPHTMQLYKLYFTTNVTSKILLYQTCINMHLDIFNI